MADKVCHMDFAAGFVFNPDCLGAYAAKLIGTAILVGAFALKLPQIYNIYTTGDVVGLSAGAFYSEVPLSTVSVVYNILQGNPFTSFGEGCIILVQNVILVFLLWSFTKPAPTVGHRVSVLASFVLVTAAAYYLPKEFQYVLPLSTLPMMTYSRLAQIHSNYKLGTTGQLSMITTFLQLGGSLARVFTTIMEVGWDMSLLSVCALSTVLSGILMSQASCAAYFCMDSYQVLVGACRCLFANIPKCSFVTTQCADHLLQLHEEGAKEETAVIPADQLMHIAAHMVHCGIDNSVSTCS